MDWPARSPDLNPIENVWAVMVREVYSGAHQFENVQELENAVFNAWGKIEKPLAG